MSHQDDKELNDLLTPLRELSPNDLQMQKWRMAVKRELQKNLITTTRGKWFMQLTAAAVVGALVGAVVLRSLGTTPASIQYVSQVSDDDATFERSHDNLD